MFDPKLYLALHGQMAKLFFYLLYMCVWYNNIFWPSNWMIFYTHLNGKEESEGFSKLYIIGIFSSPIISNLWKLDSTRGS